MRAETISRWPEGNLLLSAVPADERLRWLPELELVRLKRAQVLHYAGDEVSHVHFPLDCVIAMLGISRKGTTSGLALVGKEGVAGSSIALGVRQAYAVSMVQSAGLSWRLPWTLFHEAFLRSEPTRRVVLRYLYSLVEQTAQTGVCNAQHTVEQRLCRWLLQTLARAPSTDLYLTQELVGAVLGVRREAVTVAAMHLQSRGAISYRRGHIRIVSRPLIELSACECALLLQAEDERMARDVMASGPAARRQ